MKNYIYPACILFYLLGFRLNAQQVAGIVVLEGSRTPLAYVNIGIPGKNVGTVSDEDGRFSLSIPDSLGAFAVRFTMTGLEKREISVAELSGICRHGGCLIALKEMSMPLQEVVVVPRNYIARIVGNTTSSASISAGFANNQLGHEMGVMMKIKRRPARIETVSFYLNKCVYDTIFYRLNIYETERGKPIRNIMPAPYYLKYDKSKAGTKLTLDLTDLQLWVEDDFLVSLEIIKDLGEGGLFFSAGLFNAPTWYRATSQGDWTSVPVGVGISATIQQEK